MKLAGKTFTADFDPVICNFKEIIHLKTGRNYIARVPCVPLISLSAIIDGCKRELFPDTAAASGDENAIMVRCRSFGGRAMEADLLISAEDDRLVISAKISNNDPEAEIAEIFLPHLQGIYLGDGDTIIYPHHAGEKTANPVSEYGKNKKDFWRASSVACGDIYRREINYCGLASMSWMYYYTSRDSLYIGSHDPRFPVTGVIAESSGSDSSPWMGFGFRKYYRILKGEAYSAGEYVLSVNEKDWHYGARLYRNYIAPYLNFNHNPEFLNEEYALNQCYNFKRSGTIENRFEDIPRMFEEGRKLGVRHMFLASWNRTGFDSFYPEYYPDMELGSAMEFCRGLGYVREHGGFSTLYINARIFDVKSDFHKTLGEKMAVRDEKGGMVYETYGPAKFTVNCPSDHLWRDYLIDTAEFAAKAYGCDGIYLDQLASAEPLPCFDKNHSHDNIGDFNNGNLYILKELLSRLRGMNPNAYLMTENCGDIYGSYTWGNLTWNGADYDEFFNVFKYTFPEFIQVNMVNPRKWVNNPAEQKWWFYKDMQRAVLLGSILWMGITSHFKTAGTEYTLYAEQILRFRRRIQPYIKNAAFLDREFILDISDGCDASSWRLPDGSVIILAVNAALDPQAKLTVRLPWPRGKLSRFDEEESAETREYADCPISVPICKSRLHCLIFAKAGKEIPNAVL